MPEQPRQKTAYIIYRIYNTLDGKSYIGQTTDYKRRKYDHFNELKNGHHCNTYLQNAYNKYGREVFKIQILEGVTLREELNEREMFWIAHFNSYNSGYNMDKGGRGNLAEAVSIPCKWNGVDYPSISVAARALGITDSALGVRLRKGYTCDNDLVLSMERRDARVIERNKRNNRPIFWNNVEYPSISEAAQILGIYDSTLRKWLKKGYKGDPDVLTPSEYNNRRKPVIWNGVAYTSLTSAARVLGIGIESLRGRLNRGHSTDASMEFGTKAKSVEIDGIKFHSITKAAKYFDVSTDVIKRWLKEGKIKSSARNMPKPTAIDDVVFPSVAAAARYYHVDHDTIRRWDETDGKSHPATNEPIEVLIDGITFASLTKAANHYGVSRNTVQQWAEGGKSYSVSRSISVEIDEIQFESISHAARHYGVTTDTIGRWVAKGGKSRPVIIDPTPKPATIDGISFISIKEAARHFGVDGSTIVYWLNWDGKSHKPREAVSTRIEVGGIVFDSIVQAAKHFNVARNTIQRWVEQGISPHPIAPKRSGSVEVDGMIFGSLSKAARHYSVTRRTIDHWLAEGKARLIDS